MSIFALLITDSSGTVLYENFFERSLTEQQKNDEKHKLYTILKEESKENRERGKYIFFSYDSDEKSVLFSLQNDVIFIMVTKCTVTESIMGGSSILLYTLMNNFVTSLKAVCGVKDREKDPNASLFTEAILFKNYKELNAVVNTMFVPSGVATEEEKEEEEGGDRCEGGVYVFGDPRIVDAAANFQLEKYKGK